MRTPLRFIFAAAVGSGWLATISSGADVPALRIDAGMHTAAIRKIATDTAGRLALTASHDATARLWELPSGRLLRTFRPPFEKEGVDRLHSCSLSPDGMLAVVGKSSSQGGDAASIYVFAALTGHVQHVIRELPEAPFDMAFSPNGRFLAVGFGGTGGLRVWQTQEWTEVVRDGGYDDACVGAVWVNDAELITGSADGTLRAYQPLAQQQSARTIDGAHVIIPLRQGACGRTYRLSSVALDQGARTVLIAFSGGNAVEVRSLADFSLQRRLVASALANGSISSVAAGPQGAAAGGRWQQNGLNPIQTWSAEGVAAPARVGQPCNTIMDIKALGAQGFCYATADPGWGLFDISRPTAGPALTLLGQTVLADFRNNKPGLLVSEDGAQASFSLENWGAYPVTFSVTGRQLQQGSSPPGSAPLKGPRYSGASLTGWMAETNPDDYSRFIAQGIPESAIIRGDKPQLTIGGRLIALDKGERSYCAAVSHDGRSIAVGTNWSLRRFSSAGDLLLSLPVTASIWAVNGTPDGKLIVTASADGIIRWYRAQDGRELLALFPHPDRKRWILWTPEGYYDCSPGSEDLVGWHVNRGAEQAADFFPVARFRAVFYRPDVIQQVLPTLDVDAALKKANAALGRDGDPVARIASVITSLSPPVVELETGGVLGSVTLPPDASTMELAYRVRQTSSQKISRVEIRANGRPLVLEAPLPAGNDAARVTVALPAGFTGELSVLASHALARSDAATLRVLRPTPPPESRSPALYVLSVGVSALAMNQPVLLAANDSALARKDRFQNLEFAAEDAKKVAALTAAQRGKAPHKVEIEVLLDERATTAGVRQAIRDISTKAEAGDVVLVFFSGHGNHDPKSGKFHLVTHDTDPHHEAETALSGEELSTLLGEIRGYVVLALDACHSGSVLGMQLGEKYKAPPLDISGLANQLSSAEHGIVVLSSSTPDQVSFEDSELGGGLFTKALLEGLEGKAAGKDGLISCQGLMRWIDQRVPELTGTEVSQNPVAVMPKGVPDFIISRP